MTTLDFTRPAGPMKPLHGVNNAPLRIAGGAGVQHQNEFRDAGIPYMRTHDTAGMWGGGHYVDIPNIFPNFEADENDPSSYDFAFTDAYLKPIVEAGVKPFYRLGVTIENHWKVKAYHIHPPADFAKWARICEHVVRHYNEGWAGGFHWDIEYWEIWNEPENPPMWQGTKEQFFEFYRTAARHLKTCFPSLRVGGFAGCGFYAVDDPSVSDFYKTFPVWFEDFLAYVTAPETQAPLDFFSWHLYLDRHRGPERIIRHANYVRELLDAAGLREVESIFNEWNYCGDGWDAMKEMPGAACVAAAFCLMQAGPIDKAMYYDALPTRTYCGLFYFPSQRTTPCYEAFKAFNELYKLGTAASCSTDEKDLYLCAAASESGQAFLLVNRSDEPRQVTPVLAGAAPAFVLHRLDADHPALVAVGTFRPGETLALPPLSILLCATATEAASSPAELDTTPFNGIAPN